MIIYTQPGNCVTCGEELTETTTQIPGQENFSVYVCKKCIEAEYIPKQSDKKEPIRLGFNYLKINDNGNLEIAEPNGVLGEPDIIVIQKEDFESLIKYIE